MEIKYWSLYDRLFLIRKEEQTEMCSCLKTLWKIMYIIMIRLLDSLYRDMNGEWVDMAALANNIVTWKAIKLIINCINQNIN